MRKLVVQGDAGAGGDTHDTQQIDPSRYPHQHLRGVIGPDTPGHHRDRHRRHRSAEQSGHQRDDPGQAAVLDRLLDLLLVSTVRTWFARSDTNAPGWYLAHADPVLAPVLKVIEHRPEHPWTVGSLADTAGVSRATLARRFTDVVGEPPMTFLTHWRLALAADLILDPEATLTSVARQVGDGSPFALSAAFTRVRGVSPHTHRTAGTSTAP